MYLFGYHRALMVYPVSIDKYEREARPKYDFFRQVLIVSAVDKDKHALIIHVKIIVPMDGFIHVTSW